MYMTTKSWRCSISCDTKACAASTSSSSNAGVQAVPMYRPADKTSKHNTIHREPTLMFRINNFPKNNWDELDCSTTAKACQKPSGLGLKGQRSTPCRQRLRCQLIPTSQT